MYRTSSEKSLLNWAGGIVVAILMVIFLSPFSVVPAGSRGVMTTLGKPSEEVFGEGFHFKIPLVQQMYMMDVRINKSEGE